IGATWGVPSWSTWGTSRASGEDSPSRSRSNREMAEQTEGSIEIAATPAEIMKVIMDFGAYPRWAQGVRMAKVLKRDVSGRPSEVSMEAGQMGVNAQYTLSYRYKAKDGGLSWTTKEASGAVK